MENNDRNREPKIEIREIKPNTPEYSILPNYNVEYLEGESPKWVDRFPSNRTDGKTLVFHDVTTKEMKRIMHLFEYAAIENPIYNDFWKTMAKKTEFNILNYPE